MEGQNEVSRFGRHVGDAGSIVKKGKSSLNKRDRSQFRFHFDPPRIKLAQVHGGLTMLPQVVRFASHPGLFQVTVDYCANLDCECADVRFHLAAKSGDGGTAAKPTRLEIRVDPESWSEVDPPERPEAQAKIVSEFLYDFPPSEREAFAAMARDKKQTQRRLREYRLEPDDIDRGFLIPYKQIASEEGSIASGGTAYSFGFLHEEHEYLVEDLYCANPSCGCREVHLRFFELHRGAGKDDGHVAKDSFMAVMSLNGNLKIKDSGDLTRGQALGIASAWHANAGDVLETLKWRYDKIKEIGRRSMPSAGAEGRGIGPAAINRPLVRALSTPARPGRNDPCPCGSGKKFKRCCGVSNAARQDDDFTQHGFGAK
jgi:hypothetical protein